MKRFCALFATVTLSVCFTVPALAWTVDDVDWNEVTVTIQEPGSAPANNPSSWAKSEVDQAIAAGLVPSLTGNPNYTDAITREQFAELVVCMVEKAQGGELDVPGFVFYDCENPQVMKAAGAGIVNGVGDDHFAPTTKTDREQIATMLARAISHLEVRKGKDITPAAADLGKFTDKAQVSSWAADGVGLLAANGIMKGTSATTLSPKASCTVEQSILLTYRLYSAMQ